MPKYLYNPRNGRVMIATQEKYDRVDDYDNPYFISCNSPEGPTGSIQVHKASEIEKPIIGKIPEADATKIEVKGSEDLIDIVMASEDKDELIQIANDLGFKITKNMKIKTMQKKISAKLEEMNIF